MHQLRNTRKLRPQAYEQFGHRAIWPVQMVDVYFQTTDGRELVFRRYTQPEKDLEILLSQLGRELPEQPPQRITARVRLGAPAA